MLIPLAFVLPLGLDSFAVAAAPGHRRAAGPATLAHLCRPGHTECVAWYAMINATRHVHSHAE